MQLYKQTCSCKANNYFDFKLIEAKTTIIYYITCITYTSNTSMCNTFICMTFTNIAVTRTAANTIKQYSQNT